ncbi:putative F-box protein At3g16210 [Vicia villosa]|uniref:putative F-box protein At3g16210 n=1 Tax=Vicia villosa TaxID=3911 RepID=UPI00273AC661|nr:putative F-box protein At3g16210 [Vicia villosa]
MDITLTDSNVQVSNHIPDDIIFSILSKLSLKSLKRFECVCKPWSLLFDSPSFMTMYRNYFLSKDHSFYDDMSLLLHLKGENALYSLSGERFENMVKLDWPKLSLRDGRNNYFFDVLGPISFSGTLFLQYHYIGDDRKFIAWKPTTTEFKIIYAESYRNSNVWSDQYQVGYDHVKDDYKMIRRTHYFPTSNHGISSFWEIFSLNNKSWRKIHDSFPDSYICGEEVYVDGVSHWWEKTKTFTYLESFDFSKESFITTLMPSYTDDVFVFNSIKWTRKRILTVLNGSVAFIVNFEETNTFHISILGELGVKESWIKLFIVGPLSCLKTPIGIGKKGNILIRKKDNKLACFDISTGTIDEIGVTTKSHGKILFYKKRFLSNGGIYSKFSSCFHHSEAI